MRLTTRGKAVLTFAILTPILVFGKVQAGPMEGVTTVTLNVKAYPCQEDETILGRGQFEGGVWTRYTCIPADNLGGAGR